MAFLAIVYLVVRLKLNPELVFSFFKRTRKAVRDDFKQEETSEVQQTEYEQEVVRELVNKTDDQVDAPDNTSVPLQPAVEPVSSSKDPARENSTTSEEPEIQMEVEEAREEETVEENLSKRLVEDFGEFDPTLELSNYKFPPIDLLKDYTGGKGITIDQEELEENKNRIVNTLNNYKIGIANIKATVGPTVTLYEIVPEAGIRISKIKNLEDDIALSL
jgi:S-DNA-T family DNA segregation ATPase FtsK/SpoIIIE